MERKLYQTPEMEVIDVMVQSIIATSGIEIPGYEPGGELE